MQIQQTRLQFMPSKPHLLSSPLPDVGGQGPEPRMTLKGRLVRPEQRPREAVGRICRWVVQSTKFLYRLWKALTDLKQRVS